MLKKASSLPSCCVSPKGERKASSWWDPRGTFAYVLLPSGVHNQGGTTDRLIMFPDETARNHFAEAGWSPLVNANTTETPANA